MEAIPWVKMEPMFDQWQGPVWPEEIELQDDLSPSAWILPRLLSSFLTGGEGMPVGAIVPSGLPAYVRVLHPANTRVTPSSQPSRSSSGRGNPASTDPLSQLSNMAFTVSTISRS